jgi:hypothetical protein
MKHGWRRYERASPVCGSEASDSGTASNSEDDSLPPKSGSGLQHQLPENGCDVPGVVVAAMMGALEG